MSTTAEASAVFSLSCKSLSEADSRTLRSSSLENGALRAQQPASSFLCLLPAKLDGDHPRWFSSTAFRISSAASNAPVGVSRVNQNNWERALVAARKAESLPSTAAASYNVRNRTSMTQNRPIVTFSK
jgi:hypothetical protein